MRTDDRLVPTTLKDVARRAGRRQIGAQRGAMVDEERVEEEEDIIRTTGHLWPFGKVTLYAQQIGAKRGSIMDDEGAAEKENINNTARPSTRDDWKEGTEKRVSRRRTGQAWETHSGGGG